MESDHLFYLFMGITLALRILIPAVFHAVQEERKPPTVEPQDKGQQ